MQVQGKKRIFKLTAILITCLFALRLWFLFSSEQVRVKPGNQAGCRLEDQCLFNRALALGLIRLEDDFLLQVTPPDQRFENDSEKAGQLKKIYFSPAGVLLRQEIQRWNAGRLVSAVRHRVVDDNGRAVASRINWRAYQQPAQGVRYFVHTTTTVPESFGYVHNALLRPGFGDWQAAAESERHMVFEGDFILKKKGVVSIQLIGSVKDFQVRAAEKSVQIHSVKRQEKACHPGKRVNCASTHGAIITLNLSANRYPAAATVRLQVDPARNGSLESAGLHIHLDKDRKPAWRSLTPQRQNTPQNVQILAANRRLTDDHGRANACAQALGLVPVVGVDRNFAFSLNGAFSQAGLPPSQQRIQLTIDPLLQQHAHEVLSQSMSTAGTKYQSPWMKVPREFFTGKFMRRRRAALLVMNADNGDILAVAGWPQVPSLESLTPWDIHAYHDVYEKNGHISPFEVQGWQSTTRENTPGSIFKPLVALAAAKRLQQIPSPYLSTMIKGIHKDHWKQVHRRGNYPAPAVNDGAYKPLEKKKAIRNFRSEPLSRHFNDVGVLGLTQAVENSSNIWFVKLALEMDGENMRRLHAMGRARNWDALRREPMEKKTRVIDQALTQYPLALRQTMVEFGFGQKAGPALLDFELNRASIPWENTFLLKQVLHAAPSNGDILRPDFFLRENLEFPGAQSAIGQAGIQVTPLHMAVVFSSIASQKMLQPRLISSIGSSVLQPRPFQPISVDQDTYRQLLNGLKAVPESGTARGTFKNHRDGELIYAKTGTAEIKKNNSKTVWFLGWRERDEHPEHRREPRRLAFACMITHMTGRATGGGVCAPLVAEFFKRINDKSQSELPACPGKATQIQASDHEQPHILFQ